MIQLLPSVLYMIAPQERDRIHVQLLAPSVRVELIIKSIEHILFATEIHVARLKSSRRADIQEREYISLSDGKQHEIRNNYFEISLQQRIRRAARVAGNIFGAMHFLLCIYMSRCLMRFSSAI